MGSQARTGLERLRTAAVSGWMAGYAVLAVGLRRLAPVFDGLARSMRGGAERLERAAAGGRALLNPAPAADGPVPSPVPAVLPEETIVAPRRPVVSDKTIVARPAFLDALSPAPPPPQPQAGRVPALPPPRGWRSTTEARSLPAEAETAPGTAGDTRSDG